MVLEAEICNRVTAEKENFARQTTTLNRHTLARFG